MPRDPTLRRRLLDFEIGLDARVSETVVAYDWGRAFLCPSAPLVWDSSWLALEEPGMKAAEVVALADRVFGEAGFSHRTVVPCEEADGERLLGEAGSLEGWETERVLYMSWRGDAGRRPAAGVRETTLGEIGPLRRELIRESLPEKTIEIEETVAQLLEIEHRFGLAGGDRWFVAPGDGPPASACRLLAGGGIAQVEDVGTVRPARGKGLAQAVVLAALVQARAAEPEVIFLSADAKDWPRLMYEKLGFAPVGELHVLRKAPPK